MLRVLALILLSADVAFAQGWNQWAANARHDSASAAAGQSLDRIEAGMLIDPFVVQEKTDALGDLLTHYPVPLVDGDEIVTIFKSGTYTDLFHHDSQIWNVRLTQRNGIEYTTRWTYASDWKPVPGPQNNGSGPSWEPVYHPVLSADSVWAPGAGGTIDRLSRADGHRIQRFNPFGTSIDPTIYVTGPPSINAAGDIYYNAIRFAATGTPWTSDVRGAWLVKIAADGTMTKASFSSIVTGAPAADAQCTSAFLDSQLPWPPSTNATAPAIPCGSQRPGINVAPAIGTDAVYTISRAHLNDRWGYLVAVNLDLTPRWSASLRNRFHDGCNVAIPPNGTPGGCRAGALTGVDPADNQAGSGRVSDNGTSSPVIAPDGKIFYGAYTRYNYSQGHLMSFDAGGSFQAAYGWGWDLTPSIYSHGQTYSLIIKENHYDGPSYCVVDAVCPFERTFNTPGDPEQYFITALGPGLQPEWKFRNTETKSCERTGNGISCVEDHPAGFEWCVNAVAVDGKGVSYANAEDGNLYAINPDGTLRDEIFLNLAIGAAYTPSSIGEDGRIYTQNDGRLFIISGIPGPRRRVGPR